MILYTLIRGVIRVVLRGLRLALQIVYRLLKILRIRLLALYLIVCGLLQLCFNFFYGAAAPFFWIGLAACCAVTLFGWFSRFTEGARRNRVTRKKTPSQKTPAEQPKEVRPARTEVRKKPASPTFYRVEGHPDYAFYEYDDRYELFHHTGSGWRYVKTDYKEEVNKP